MKWLYNGVEFDKDISKLYGFVYRLTYVDKQNKQLTYIGKKCFWSFITKPLGKKELALITDNRVKKYKEIKKESDWIKYEGSCKTIPTDAKLVKKEILLLATDKINLSYWEEYYLFGLHCIMDDSNLNGNIGGTYFRGKILYKGGYNGL